MFHPRPADIHALPHRWRTAIDSNEFAPAIKLSQGSAYLYLLADDVDDLYEQLESTLSMFGRKPSPTAQEDVDKIVKTRLARERAKHTEQAAELEERITELEERKTELEEQVKSWRAHARKHEDRWKALQEQINNQEAA